jgi:hypothetical protein
MNGSIEKNISRTKLFAELSNAVSNSASILVGDASIRYRKLAG